MDGIRLIVLIVKKDYRKIMNDAPKRKFSIADLLDIDKMRAHEKEMNTFYKKDSRKVSEKRLKALQEKNNSEDLNNFEVEGAKLNDWGGEIADEELNPHELENIT